MLMPKISPRMIEGRKLTGFRIDARKVASFMQIAIGTGQGQVVQGVRPAVFPGYNMLNLQ